MLYCACSAEQGAGVATSPILTAPVYISARNREHVNSSFLSLVFDVDFFNQQLRQIGYPEMVRLNDFLAHLSNKIMLQ